MEIAESNVELETFREHTRSAVSTLPDVVWSVVVPSGEVCYVSPAVTEVFGRTQEKIDDTATTTAWGDFVHSDDKVRVLAAWDQAANGGIFESDHRTLTPSGETRWIQAVATPPPIQAAESFRMDGISRDITERREQERKTAQLSRLHAVLRGDTRL